MPLKKGDVKSSSKKPLKKGDVKSSSKKPLKKEGVKPSSKKPLKKGGGLQTLIERLKNPKYPQYPQYPQDPDYVEPSPLKRSMLSNIHSSQNLPLEKPQSALALNRKNAKTYALVERLQGRSPPRSSLSAIYRRLKPPENHHQKTHH